MARLGALATVQRTVGRHDQPNEEEVDDVEDGDTPYDLFRGPRDLLFGVGRFRSGQSGQFSASVGERRSDEDAAEAVEAVEERGIR